MNSAGRGCGDEDGFSKEKEDGWWGWGWGWGNGSGGAGWQFAVEWLIK